MQADLLTYLEAIESKEAALAKVADNNKEWMRLGLIQLEQFARDAGSWGNLEHGFTGEDIRRMIVPLCGHPHHNNAFGAMVQQAIRRKIIEPTGQYRAMRAEGSHGRRTAIYIWCGK